MKKVFSIFLAMLGIAAIAETKVLCTTQPMMILAKASLHRIPGIKLEQMISSSLGCPHDYVLTPEDMRKLSTADVIIMNGLGMEDFLEKALPKLKKGVVLLDTSKDVKGLLDSADSCTNNAQHDHAKCNHAKNEHLFAGPETAAQAALNISKYFIQVLNPPVWLESIAGGSTAHSTPQAETSGSATVVEHCPTQEMS